MKKSKNTKTFSKLDFVDEEGRHDIYNWSERRQRKYQGFRKSLHILQIYAFNTHLLRSFVENFNFMVILQMTLAAFITYLCKDFDISYDVHVSLFISPIVFPLAFSINTDFQRKEKVLEDLANFKSSAMMWFFCMRDWREACSMDLEYMKAVRNKIKGIVFHLREYLLTEKLDRRKFIVRVIYEDLSDANQLNEKVRCSSMPANSPLVARIIHFVNMMCLSFERLRVIREYRSPRSIRSFTKVLIFILPLLLSPYYVYLGSKIHLKNNKDTLGSNTWSPYYISVMVAFVFGALQGVQDKLDDPFDGMSEDDINLDTLDEWTLQSLEATCHRAYKVGRFQVVSSNMDGKNPTQQPPAGITDPLLAFDRDTKEDLADELELGFHPYAGVLNNIQGNMTILRGGRVKKREKSFDDLGNLDRKSLLINQALFSEQQNLQETIKGISLPYAEDETETIRLIPSLNRLPSVDIIDADSPCLPSTTLDFTGNEAPTYGVASYLASVRRNNLPLRSQLDRQMSRNSSVCSNLSKRSSRCSSVCSTSEVTNDRVKAEFYIGDEVIKRLSPIYQDVPSGRFTVANGSSASINPLILNMHQNSDEDTDDDDDDENIPLELTSLFNNIQRNSAIFDNLQHRNSSVLDNLHHRNSSVLDNLQHRNSSVLDNLQHRNSSCVEHLQNGNSPVFENIQQQMNSTIFDNLQQRNSPGVENLLQQRNSPVSENVQHVNSPIFDNLQQRSSPVLDNLQQVNPTGVENVHQRNSPVFENLQQRNSSTLEHFQRSTSPLFCNIQRSNSLSVNNLHDSMQQNNSLLNNSHQSSPLLKVSNGNLSNGINKSPKSRFTVSKSTSNVNNDVNGESSCDDITLTNSRPDDIHRSPKYQTPPKSQYTLRTNDSCASVNPLIINMYQNSDEDADDDEDLPVELINTPLFDQRNSPVSEHVHHSNSNLQSNENLHKINENMHMRNSPLFDNRELNNIPLFDSLSPKSKQRFIINGVGRNNHAIIGNGNVIQDLKDDVFY